MVLLNIETNSKPIYFEEIHSISSDNADVKFINNSAVQRGGALYFNLVTNYCNVFPKPFNASFSFINNSAKIAGNSIYFSIPQSCQTNNRDIQSLLNVTKTFKYSQPVQFRISPVVTSPYNIKLYPPAIVISNSSNDYAIQQSKMLQVNASVFDYFDKIIHASLSIELSNYHLVTLDIYLISHSDNAFVIHALT